MPLEPLGPRWEPLLRRAAAALPADGFAPVSAPLSLLARYLDEVVTWNQKTDLTAARTAEELVDLTLADAWVVASASEEHARATWVDVGSGAGAPGLIAAMLLPECRMTLVEPRDRRVSFLRSTAGKLGLKGITVERGRSDRLTERRFTVALSRATLPPAEWVEEGARLAHSAMWLLLARDEPPEHAGFRVDVDIRYEWPLTAVPRRAVRYVPLAGTT